MRAWIAVLMTVLALVNASVACAGVRPVIAAPAHPCCPAPANPSPGECVQFGCVLTEGAILPAGLAGDAPESAVAVAGALAPEGAMAESIDVVLAWPIAQVRFLTFHQLRI